MNAKSLLQVKELRKQFGKQEVLKGITTDIKTGEVVCVIGPSGLGKSILLRCLDRLREASSGQILFEDVDLCDKKTDIDGMRQRIGTVFQQFNLFPHMDILKNPTFGPMEPQKRSQEEVEVYAMELLHKVGLAERVNAHPQQFSGGQRQRIAIVRALCMKPDVMLFGEPVLALDPEMVGEALNVMKDLAAQKMTMIAVTHEMGLACEVASRVMFLADGYFLEEGSPAEPFGSPKNEKSQSFLSKVLQERGGIHAVKGRKQAFSAYVPSFSFA